MQSVNCGLLNVQSAKNKTFEIRQTIVDGCLDFYAITETWLTKFDSAAIQEMTPVTHSFLHKPRCTGRGGGVGLFVSNSIKKVKVCKSQGFESFELLQVECQVGGSKVTFITIYRPPATSPGLFIDELELYLETVDTISSNVIVLGDFNFWLDTPGARYVQRFTDMLATFNLVNVVNKPTSICGHIIDLVLVDTSGDLVRNLQVDDVCSLSPVHKLVMFNLNLLLSKRQVKNISFRSRRNFNSDGLLSLVCNKIVEQYGDSCNHGWAAKGECHDCLYNLYNYTLKYEYDKMCPIVEKKIIVKDESPWFNNDINKAKNNKKKMERRWRKYRTEECRHAYTQARNYELRLVTKRKCSYYKEKTEMAGSNIHELYKILDSLTGDKRKHELPESCSDSKLANDFVYFFDNKIKNIISTFVSDSSHMVVSEQTSDIKLSEFRIESELTVSEMIKKAKPTYSAIDPMPFKLFNRNKRFDRLVSVITKMVNVSIANGVFPNSEKQAIVTPILKGNLDPQSFSSFRPVSNLTFQSKILEKVILTQLMDYLDMVGAIHDNQSAYRRLYSTETALCSIVSDMRTLMDDGKCGLLVLLDLSAAFDTVVHSVLLSVCERIGIIGAALSYLKSYLTGRNYCVKIGNEFSDPIPLTRGVPQGSVLGPILFCLYTTDLSALLEKYEVRFKLFADDTQFYMSFTNIHDSETYLSSVLTDIKQWMDSRQLKLNQDKTECLYVGRRTDFDSLGVRKLKVNDREITINKCVKSLGVMLDSELMMRDQIGHVVQVAGYHLRNLAFVRKYLDQSVMTKLVYNHVLSKLDYCNSLYYGLPDYLLKKLQMIMNRAARLIRGLSRRDRITPALIQLHWLPIKARIVYKQCAMVHQALNYGKPVYMRDMLLDFHVDTNVELRHSSEVNRLLEPRFRRECGRRAFANSAPRLYNNLPSFVRAAETAALFKKRLKTHLFTLSYDLINEEMRPSFRL